MAHGAAPAIGFHLPTAHVACMHKSTSVMACLCITTSSVNLRGDAPIYHNYNAHNKRAHVRIAYTLQNTKAMIYGSYEQELPMF